MTHRLLRSTFVLAALVLLVLLSIVGLWQRDRTERRLIELQEVADRNERRIAELEVRVGRAAGEGTALGLGAAEPDYVREGLADPDNLLEPDPDRPWLPVDAPRGGTLRLHFPVEPDGFHVPAHLSSVARELTSFTNLQVARRHRGDPSSWGPDLAWKVTTVDQGLTWTVELRRDLSWQEPVVGSSDGHEWLEGEHPVTAHDLVFALDLIGDPQVTGAAPLRSYLEHLAAYRAIDDHTLELRFDLREYGNRTLVMQLFPVPEFLYGHDETGAPFPPEIRGSAFQAHWYPFALGCGPYRMVEYEPGERIVLERSLRYPLERPAFDRVVYLLLSSDTHVARKLRTGELDLAWLPPARYRSEVLRGGPDSPFVDGTLVGGRWQESSWFYVGWNLRNPLFADRRVRQALSSALDVETVLAELFAGVGERTTGPMPSHLPGYDASVEPRPFDLDLAATLLEEAGWTDEDGDGVREREIDGERRSFEFTLLVPSSSSETIALAALYKEALAQIGVRLQLQSLEWSALLHARDDGDFDALTLAWQSAPEPDFRQIWHSSQADVPGSSNYIGFRNPEADRLIEQMNAAHGAEERVRLSRRFHALLADEQPYTFLFSIERPAYWSRRLAGVSFGLAPPYRNHLPWYFAEGEP
jgi:peptide/nickel transport system substrate-binding protein